MEPYAQEMKEPSALVTLKEYALFAPVIGGGLAIVFDVGFFYGLNSGFFSSFSLSEHLVFALGALPIAVVLVVVGALELAMITHTWRIVKWQKEYAVIGLMLGLLVACGIEILRREYLVAASLATVVASLAPLYFLHVQYRSQFALIFSAPVLGLCISFMMGVNMAHQQLTDATQRSRIELEGGKSIEGKFIRAGERGVLIYQPLNKTFSLVPWTKIVDVQNEN